MSTLFAIGEALIDFIPEDSGVGISEVSGFIPKVGGAPANVCGAFTKLGGHSALITQLGADPFGDKIQKELADYGIDCSYIRRTDEANTSLAFVALKSNGNREFVFYRKPGADMLYKSEYIEDSWFKDGFALHFCSVSLGNFPMKEAHKKAIEAARKNGLIISFDPNLRKNLWSSEADLRNAVLEFIPMADILKISDEELDFITGTTEIEQALTKLFTGNVKLVIYTAGANGAMAFTRAAKASAPCEKVKAIDTTGAGDAFIGSFLYSLCEQKITASTIWNMSDDQLEKMLAFSNRYCGISVQKKGAIASYPTIAELTE